MANITTVTKDQALQDLVKNYSIFVIPGEDYKVERVFDNTAILHVYADEYYSLLCVWNGVSWSYYER